MGWKRFLLGGCVFYTIFNLCILVIALAINGNLSDIMIEPAWFLRTLFYSFVLSFAGMIRKSEKLPAWCRILIHAVCVVGGFILAFLVAFVQKQSYTVGKTFVIVIALIILYAAIYPLAALIGRKISSALADKGPASKSNQK